MVRLCKKCGSRVQSFGLNPDDPQFHCIGCKIMLPSEDVLLVETSKHTKMESIKIIQELGEEYGWKFK